MSLTTINTVTGAEPTPEDQAHIDAMIAKIDGTKPATPAADLTPPTTLLAGKYKTIEELEKGYQELQKAYSAKTPVTPAADAATVKDPLAIADPPAAADADATADAAKVVENAGLDFDTFTAEFTEKGELSAESYESLNKAGIPKTMVDAYIEGQKVIAAQATTRVFDTVGGEAEYTKLMEWAKTGVSVEERKVYNDVCATGDINQILLAAKGLKATYEDANGKAPQLLTAVTTTTTGNTDTYGSKSQLTAAMADPRYAKDPAYREEVMQKLSRSKVF